jgi:hypothetical protein
MKPGGSSVISAKGKECLYTEIWCRNFLRKIHMRDKEGDGNLREMGCEDGR